MATKKWPQDKQWKRFKQLSRQEFACEPDAQQAVQRLPKKLQFYQLDDVQLIPHFSHGKSGRPSKNQKPTQCHYQIDASLIPNQDAIATEKQKARRFILATSVLDSEQLSNDQLLIEYKEQQSTERGFRFLKDPLFFTSSVFLKSPKRIAPGSNGYGLIPFSFSPSSTRFTFSFSPSSTNYS